MRSNTLERLNLYFSHLIWKLQLNVCIFIWTSNKLQLFDELLLGLQMRKLTNAVTGARNCKLTNLWADFWCTKTPGNSLMLFNYKMTFTFKIQLQICTFGYCTSDCVISQKINMHFSFVKSWLKHSIRW